MELGKQSKSRRGSWEKSTRAPDRLPNRGSDAKRWGKPVTTAATTFLGSLAKIAPPRLRNPLRRVRLFEALDAACQHSSVWVSGPPGAGKTTLINHYLCGQQRKKLWYQIDVGDRDVASLLHHIGVAAQVLAPLVTEPLPEFALHCRNDIPAFFRRYFRVLFMQIGPCDIVFDNYQEIGDDALLHTALAIAMVELPTDSHVFVLSRQTPPPVFASALVNGSMTHIDWCALQLSEQEARQLAALRNITPDIFEQERLYELSRGWIAGFLVLLDKQRKLDQRSANVSTMLPEVLFSYFESKHSSNPVLPRMI